MATTISRVPTLLVRTATLLLLLQLSTNANAEILTPFPSCPALTSYYIREAVHRVGPTGLSINCHRRFARSGFGAEDSVVSDSPVPQRKNAPQAGTDFSETNVQVSGVDEPDVIKTDGKKIYVLHDRDFIVASVIVPGSSAVIKGRLRLPSYASDILIEGNHVLVIASEYDSVVPVPKGNDKSSFPRRFASPLTVVYQIRIAGTVPILVATLRMQGNYVSAREVSGTARIVMTYNPENYINFTSPQGKVTQRMATQRNIAILKKTTFKDWIPRYHLSRRNCGKSGCKQLVSVGFLVTCARVFRPKMTFGGFQLLTVTTVPVAGLLKPGSSSAIASEGQTVYSTAMSLYVTTTEYSRDFEGLEDDASSGPKFTTSFHKFALKATSAQYIASGEVSGSVINQFAMHEYDGTFFIATTEGSPWWNNRDTSKSKVTSYKVNKKTRALVQVGRVGNLGVGERIFSVRYIQDTCYVVTFREVDPLYIVDLSNVAKLEVTGELKIPGFSSYLHPIAPGRILGVGQEATPRGRTTGAKVTLFDVSDKTKPKELSKWSLKGGFSGAEWDHRAFLYWEPEGVAVLPVNVYGNKENRFTGSIVLDVSDKAITERGRLSHKPCCGEGNNFTPSIDRNFILGKIYLWSKSYEQLQANNIQNLMFKSRLVLKRKMVKKPPQKKLPLELE